MAKTNHQQQRFDIADNDRISKLPDSILCHILSFLPTKDTVTTSCLSKRWRFTWTSVDVLDLSDQSFHSMHVPKRQRTSACMKSFKNFVSMALILRSHPVVRRFRLQLNNAYAESDVHSWIFAAITHSVKELDLSTEERVTLPRVVYNCGTMVELKLDSDIELNVPESIRLPSLKVLHLTNIPTLCGASVSILLSGASNLEVLFIDTHYSDNTKNYNIVSSSLQHFELYNSANKNHYRVIINAPKLIFLYLTDERQKVEVDVEIEHAPSVTEAAFDFTGSHCHKEENFRAKTLGFWNMKNVKILSSPLVLLILNEAVIYNRCLVALTIRYCGHDLPMLLRILRKFPNLQVLKLYKVSYCQHSEVISDAWKKEKLGIDCLKNSLKRLEFEGFKMTAEEMEIVKFFVHNARALTEVRLETQAMHRSESEKALIRKICSLLTYSNALKIMIF